MDDPSPTGLVRKAIKLGRRFKGYCEWRESAARRIRERPFCQDLTPEGIKQLLGDYVIDAQGEVVQIEEKRDEKRQEGYGFYYKVVIPVPGLPRGLFVELVLIDDDPSDPSVSIVNAHEQNA
jgi:hypothetical protein